MSPARQAEESLGAAFLNNRTLRTILVAKSDLCSTPATGQCEKGGHRLQFLRQQIQQRTVGLGYAGCVNPMPLPVLAVALLQKAHHGLCGERSAESQRRDPDIVALQRVQQSDQLSTESPQRTKAWPRMLGFHPVELH